MQKINEKLYNWASIIDPNAIVQAERTARLPFVERVSLMPDAHVGMGATVGSVIGTNGAICPSAVGVDIGCLDGDTEFLSPSGWVKISEYSDELVLGYDPDNDIASFVEPLAYIKKPYEKMLHFKSSKGLDHLVTPDHKMLYWFGVKGKGYTANTMEAVDLATKHRSLAKGVQGGFKAAFGVVNELSLGLTVEELRVQIMISADGCLRERKTVENKVEVHLKKDRKIQRCRELLSAAKIEYTVYEHADGSITFAFVPPLWTKDLSFLFGCSVYPLLKAATDEAILWDGSDHTHNGTRRTFYCSSDKKNADAIQYAFAACGVRAGIYTQTYENSDWSPVHFVIPTKNAYVNIPFDDKIEEVDAPGGMAYCFTMPTGFFVVRRNNNIVVTGNCGMAAVHFSMKDSELPDNLDAFMPSVEDAIPAGVGKGHLKVSRSAETWLRDNFNKFTTELPSDLQKRALEQFGTLGSGNHFFEICLDENNDVWIVLHSGSRGLGNILASKHIKEAKALAVEKNRFLEDKDLAYFLEEDDGFALYIGDMLACQDYAAANRQMMLESAVEAFYEFLGRTIKVNEIINCHHNFTQKEVHGNQELWVTRKGAIKAGIGDKGIIPGSMGTRSYIVSGLGEPISFTSCSHGAGRVHSRSEAKRLYSTKDLRDAMQGKVWLEKSAKSLVDEIPNAYKNIDQVMEDQKDLVRVEHTLSQILNYKGV